MFNEFHNPQLPIQRCFKVCMWLHRLLIFPNLALNPMERSETLPIEFYALNYPRKGVLMAPRGCTGSRGSPT